jgi:glyoxylase-like metal-dependent hydrolase (beta-lactamase superfamily II)
MRRWKLLAAALTCAGASLTAQETAVTVDGVADAMGARALNSVDYSASGFSFAFQQAPGPGEPWPLFEVDTYKMSIDYTAPAMRLESTRAQGEHPPRGGAGQPVAGNPRSIQYLSGRRAWSENASGTAQPNPGAVADRRRQVWMTPHGIVKAALAAKAGVSGRTLSFNLEGLPVKVTVGADRMVEKIQYLIDSPVLGDVPVEVQFLDYQDRGGIRFPRHIIERTDGYLTWDLTVSEVKPNAASAITAPPNVPAAPDSPRVATAPVVDSRLLAPGVWHVIASGYASMLVEFRDFLVMFEGPVDDARSTAVNEWVAKTVPGKPIRYLVNTHAHFDHAGGMRAYVADGITIVTHEMNRSYYEKVWERPRTLRPDRLSLKPRAPVWDTMTEKKVITDGARSLELHKLQGNGHNPYLLVGYLRADKILLYGDMYNPPPGPDPRDLARTNEYVEGLYHDIADRLKLDVTTIAPVHGLPVPFDNLKKAIGLIPVSP